MDSRRRFRPRPVWSSERHGDRGTKVERPWWKWPSNRVGVGQPAPRRECECRGGNPWRESAGVDTQEKPWRELCGASVPQTDTGGRGEQPQVDE